MVILQRSANKTPRAQQLTMLYIHERFHDFISSTLGPIRDTNYKMPIFTTSRAVLMDYKYALGCVGNKPLGVQRLIKTNIHGRFRNFIAQFVEAMSDTNFKMFLFYNFKGRK